MADKLLTGTTILDLTRYFPGPFATLRLLDRGCSVIKVEDPGGDPARTMDSLGGKEGAVFRTMSRGKDFVALNLKDAEDRERFYSLVRRADVLVESFRPGVTARLGADYQTLSQINPKLVYVSLSGYGQAGALAKMAGHDLNYLSRAGVLDQLLDSGGDPIQPQIALADLFAGFAASEAMLAGLASRAITGRGSYQDVSMTDAVLSIMGLHAMLAGAGKGGHGMNDNGIGYGVFRTGDGRYVTLCAIEEKFFRNFCEATGNPDLAEYRQSEPNMSNPHYRRVAEIIAGHDFEYWSRFALEVDCCMAPVLHTEELAESLYVKERGMIEHGWGCDYVATDYMHGESFLAGERPFGAVGEDNGKYFNCQGGKK
jgi:alpha-methylacyl-CoA racemase